jgi:hypothetical protein
LFVAGEREDRSRPSLAGRLAGVALAVLLVSCQSAPEPPPPAPSAPEPEPEPAPLAPTDFDVGRAWQHLRALGDIGERTSGSRGADKARRLLSEQLSEQGAEVQAWRLRLAAGGRDRQDTEQGEEAISLLAVLPGESDDIVLLAAALDTARDGGEAQARCASGAAALLEISRALSEGPVPRPYTIWIALIDGDGLAAAESASAGDQSAGMRFPGSYALARAMADRGALERVRFAVFWHAVAPDAVVVARDLQSDRAYREVFWESARDLEQTAHFPPDAELGSSPSGHLAFLELGLRRVVSIAAASAPQTVSGAERAGAPQCSVASLDAVGTVSLEALRRIADRLSRIDRFATSPLEMAPEVAVPGASPGEFEPPVDPAATEPAEPSPESGPPASGPAQPPPGAAL